MASSLHWRLNASLSRLHSLGEDVGARCVEESLDADLELPRGGDGGGVHRAPFVRSTTWAKRSRRCRHVLMPSKAGEERRQARRELPTMLVGIELVQGMRRQRVLQQMPAPPDVY